MGVLSYFRDFFEDSAGDFSHGELFWCPVSYTEETPRVLSVNRVDPSTHSQLDFNLEPVGALHYRGQRQLPIKLLNMSANEELLAAKSKRRPVVIMASASIGEADIASLPSEESRRSKVLAKNVYLVAPLYSCSTMVSPTTYGAELVSRIRRLEYPHLFCLPDFKVSDVQPKSVVRYDCLQATYLARGSQRIGKRLRSDVLAVMQEQLSWFLLGDMSAELGELRDLLSES